MIYDYIIVGGGPCGMTMAHVISRYRKNAKILLLDREKSLGGCHRVRRVESNLFTEHGPRIYLDNYKKFKQLIKEADIDFDQFMVPYNFQFLNISDNILKKLGVRELFAFALAYSKHFLNLREWSHKLSVQDWMDKYKFNPEIQDYIDRACRLTDGAGADRYTVFEFLELMNQNSLYQVREPNIPNDLGMMGKWEKFLQARPNIHIKTGAHVDKIKLNQLHQIQVNGYQTYQGEHLLLAIPPKHLVQLLDQSKIYDAFGSWKKLTKWEKDSRYLVYIPIFYHWIRKTVGLHKVWGLPEKSEWGLVFIVMSDYMTFPKSSTKDMISIAITKPNAISENIGKSANQCDKDEILLEVYRQMLEIFPEIKNNPPDKQIISPGVFRNDMGEWETKDTAFMLTPKGGFGPRESSHYPNFYSVGCHNGNSNYNFTALESAVQNGLSMCHQLIPESKKGYKTSGIFTIQKLLYLIITFGIIMFLMNKYYL